MLSENLRALPYLVHTNRELGLMLAGKKPLSIFSTVEGHDPECLLRYLRMFDRHVASGRIVKSEIGTTLPQLHDAIYRRIFYTLPNEEWRTDAMLELLNLPGPWSQERERRYGALLGYEDWQNDVWADRFPVIRNA
jgi:hypothetical protein